MEGENDRRRRTCRVVMAVCCTILVLTVVAVSLGLSLRTTDTFKTTFIAKCERFTDKNQSFSCTELWSQFEQAYVAQDPCKVTVDAYDPLVSAAPVNVACSTMMFWSKTKVMVQEFTRKMKCFSTVEDTLLGFVLDGLTWCGKEGSSKTFTSGCPGWSQCENNPVRSFWRRLSAAFADSACGDVPVMLNGSIATPFDNTSVFASIEVKRFSSTRVKGLTVVLVTPDNAGTNCDSASLKDLQGQLAPEIKYKCKQVTEYNLQSCISNSTGICQECW